MRVCTEPDCPVLIKTGTRDGRCDVHRRARDKARGTRQVRGYDAAHDKLRAEWQRRIDAGETVICWRCLKVRIVGRAWHLGHDDYDRSGYRGPECVPCNTATSGRK